MAAFVLVDVWTLNSNQPKVFDLDRNPLQLAPQEIARFKKKFHKLVTKLPKGAACCAVAKSANLKVGAPPHPKNCHSLLAPTMQGLRFDKLVGHGLSEKWSYHAEEQLLVESGLTDLDIDSIMIDIEPCYDNRYPGHYCTDLFRPAGRIVQTPQGPKTLKFSPKYGHDYTPVFFLTYQPPKGEKADAQAWKPKSLGAYIDALANLIGPPPGVVLFKPGDLKH